MACDAKFQWSTCTGVQVTLMLLLVAGASRPAARPLSMQLSRAVVARPQLGLPSRSRSSSHLGATTALLAAAPGLRGSRKSSERRMPLWSEQHLFLTQIQTGDGQRLNVLVDTGSGNLAVPSAACLSPGCTGHHHFRAEEDDEGRFLGLSLSDIQLTYGTGHLAGSGFEGHVCLGGRQRQATGFQELGAGPEDRDSGADLPSVGCGLLRFVVASAESEEFERYKFDGILGLGLPPQGVGQGFNVVDTLVRQDVLPQAYFVLQLRSTGNSTLTLGGTTAACLRDSETGVESGNVSFEAVDNMSTPMDGERNEAYVPCTNASWLPVDVRHGEWAVALADVALDGSRLNLCESRGCRAVIDSGCAGLAMPRHMVETLKKRIQLGDCRYRRLLPTLGFVLGNHTFRVGPERYVEVSEADPTQCRLLVQEIDAGESTRTIILGIPFLLDRTAHFDQRHMRIAVEDFGSRVA